jgi:hypothetical protein
LVCFFQHIIIHSFALTDFCPCFISCHPSLVAQDFGDAPKELLDAADAEAEANRGRRFNEEDDGLYIAPHPAAGPAAGAGGNLNFSQEIVARLLDANLKNGYECPICFDALTEGRIIPTCGHAYCVDCITGHYNMPNHNGNVEEEKVCPECRGVLELAKLVKVDDFLKKYAPQLLASPTKKAPSSKVKALFDGDGEEYDVDVKVKVKAEHMDEMSLLESEGGGSKGKRRRLIGEDEESDLDDDMDDWISSTKIDQLMKLLLETQRDNLGEKTIVFSQFIGMLNLCERPLRENKIGFVRYDGSMTATERDNAVQALQHDREINVILISLKCGSLGLNLTCANRVILLDQWWNPAVESQAIDRVHRFGQTRNVYVHRISINNTIEQRILQLQEEKQK